MLGELNIKLMLENIWTFDKPSLSKEFTWIFRKMQWTGNLLSKFGK
jgi:hypothetical protein